MTSNTGAGIRLPGTRPAAIRRRRSSRSRETLISALLGGGLIVVLLAGWQIAASTGAINSFLTSSPQLVAKSLGHQISSGILIRNIGVSAAEFAIGFALSASIGVIVGLLMGRSTYADYALEPWVWLLYCSPVVALFPLLVLIFGLGHPTVVVITVLISVVPIITNTAQAVRNVDRGLIRAARSFAAGELAIVRKVVIPASVPTIAAGLRLGVGRALVGMIVGEYFAGTGGIGYQVNVYAGQLRTSDVMAAVVVVILAGVLLNILARRLERLADSWRVDPS